MPDPATTAAATLLANALRAQNGTMTALMARAGVRTGGALLARLGCAGNTEALWERLTYSIARQLLPQDTIAPLVEDWLPHAEAMSELGAKALAAGADPLAPALPPEVKMQLIARLSRPTQVAFETYALAREVATKVKALLQEGEAAEGH
jgi:hypothetical protein